MKCNICYQYNRIVEENLPICVNCWTKTDEDTLNMIEYIKKIHNYEEKRDEFEDLYPLVRYEFN